MLSGEILEFLADFQLVRVAVPSSQGPPRQLDAVARLLSPDSLEVRFLTDSFDPASADAAGEWQITCDLEVSVFSLRATPQMLADGGPVRLLPIDCTQHRHGRRHHRVDAEIYLDYWSLEAPVSRRKPVRHLVNLSASGVRFQALRPQKERETIGLEMVLPGATLETVQCTGLVRRSERRRDRGYEIVVDLRGAPREERDKILSFCMAEQFRQMQTRMRRLATLYSPSLETAAGGQDQAR